MDEKYKGWIIQYIENRKNQFIAKKEEHILSSNSLSDLKQKIDNYKKKNFERIPFFQEGGHWYTSDRKHFYKGEITSIAEETAYGDIKAVWISVEDEKGKKHRSKEHLTFIPFYKQTEHNQKIIDKIHNINRQIKNLVKKRETEIKSLEKMTVDEILKEII